MQKVFNFLAVCSFIMSGSIIGGAGYVYANKDNILKSVVDGVIGSSQLGSALVNATNVTDEFLDTEETPPVPLQVSPF